MMEGGVQCPLCAKRGEKNKLHVFHINFDESLLVCNSAKCTYPLGLKSTESIIVKRKCDKQDGGEKKRKKVCSASGNTAVIPPADLSHHVSGKVFGLHINPTLFATTKGISVSKNLKILQPETVNLQGSSNVSQLAKTKVWEGYAAGQLGYHGSHTTGEALPGHGQVSQSTAKTSRISPSKNMPNYLLYPVSNLTQPSDGRFPISQDRQFFLQWENRDALCWLDVVLCFLVHSKSVNRALENDSPNADLRPTPQDIPPKVTNLCQSGNNSPFNIPKGSLNHGARKLGSCDNWFKGFNARNLVRTLVIAYGQAMALSLSLRNKAQSLNESHHGHHSKDMTTSTLTTLSPGKSQLFNVGLAGAESVAQSEIFLPSQTSMISDGSRSSSTTSPSFSPSKTNFALRSLLSPSSSSSSSSKGVPLKTGAGNGCSVANTGPTSFAELVSEDAGLSKARTVLNGLREKVWQELQPKLCCEKGRNDSPVFAIPFLLHSDPDICHLFQTTYKFETNCSVCGSTKIERYTKVLPTLPKVAPDFSMRHVAHTRDCFTCKAPNQKRVLHFESLAQCAMIHFVEGLPTSDLEMLDFSHGDASFHVTAVVQYKANPSHFVIWIRHQKGTQWMECDDLKGPLCRFRLRTPSIPANQIHIVFWEKDVIQSNPTPPQVMAKILTSPVPRLTSKGDTVTPVIKCSDMSLTDQPMTSIKTAAKLKASPSGHAALLTKALETTSSWSLPFTAPKSVNVRQKEPVQHRRPADPSRSVAAGQFAKVRSTTTEIETTQQAVSAGAAMPAVSLKYKTISRTLSLLQKMKGAAGRFPPVVERRPPKNETRERGENLVAPIKQANCAFAITGHMKTEKHKLETGKLSFPGLDEALSTPPSVSPPTVPLSRPPYLAAMKPLLTKTQPRTCVRYHQFEGYKPRANLCSIPDCESTLSAVNGNVFEYDSALSQAGQSMASASKQGKVPVSVCPPKKRKSSPWSSPKKRRETTTMLKTMLLSCRPKSSKLQRVSDLSPADVHCNDRNPNAQSSLSNPVHNVTEKSDATITQNYVPNPIDADNLVPIHTDDQVLCATQNLVSSNTSSPDPISAAISDTEAEDFLDSLLCNNVDTLGSRVPVIDSDYTVSDEFGLKIPDLIPSMVRPDTHSSRAFQSTGVNSGDLTKHDEVLKDLYKALDLNISMDGSGDMDQEVFKKPHSKTA